MVDALGAACATEPRCWIMECMTSSADCAVLTEGNAWVNPENDRAPVNVAAVNCVVVVTTLRRSELSPCRESSPPPPPPPRFARRNDDLNDDDGGAPLSVVVVAVVSSRVNTVDGFPVGNTAVFVVVASGDVSVAAVAVAVAVAAAADDDEDEPTATSVAVLAGQPEPVAVILTRYNGLSHLFFGFGASKRRRNSNNLLHTDKTVGS